MRYHDIFVKLGISGDFSQRERLHRVLGKAKGLPTDFTGTVKQNFKLLVALGYNPVDGIICKERANKILSDAFKKVYAMESKEAKSNTP